MQSLTYSNWAGKLGLRIPRVVLNAYKTGKSPERHSGMFLAGIQVLESLLGPGQMPAEVTMRVGSRIPIYSKVHSNSLKQIPMGEGRGPELL